MKLNKFNMVFSGFYDKKVILYLIISVTRGATMPATMFLIQKSIDSINISDYLVYNYILILGLVLLGDLLLFHISNYLELLIRHKIEKDGGLFLLSQCGKIQYCYYENSEIYRKIEGVLEKYSDTYWERIRSWSYALQLIGSLIGIVYYLFLADPWIFFVLFAAMFPPLLLSIHAAKKEFVSWESFFPFYLKARYLTEVLTKRGTVKEARIFQYKQYVEKAWESVLKKFNDGQIAANLKPRYLTGICMFLQYFVTVALLLFLFPRIQEKNLTIGMFTAIAQAMWSFTGEFQYGVIRMAQGFQEGKMLDEKIEYLLGLKQEKCIEEENVSDFESLVLKDIWFRYNLETPYILKGINMEIRKGEKIALVGQNGSGKTTLIKILLGLLVPEKGEILLNGILITDRNRGLLRKNETVVFQDYRKYSMYLMESINLGKKGKRVSESEVIKVLHILQPERDFLTDLEDGINTFLGKEIQNGQELSGGQWQTIVLARAILSEKPVAILDEPTAALDPLAETAVYNLIYEKIEEKSLLLVTHRLGAVVQADCIYVLKEGKILESGNHMALLDKKGDYEKLFETQREWYLGRKKGEE